MWLFLGWIFLNFLFQLCIVPKATYILYSPRPPPITQALNQHSSFYSSTSMPSWPMKDTLCWWLCCQSICLPTSSRGSEHARKKFPNRPILVNSMQHLYSGPSQHSPDIVGKYQSGSYEPGKSYSQFPFIQTEAERRSPTIDRKWARLMYVYMYICLYVCMVFANVWRFMAPSESKLVPYDSHVNSALLRHESIGMWWVTTWRARGTWS